MSQVRVLPGAPIPQSHTRRMAFFNYQEDIILSWIKKNVSFYVLTAVLTVVILVANYWYILRFPMLHSRPLDAGSEFDIIVVGAEPEGISAAISASRSGAKVLMIDPHTNVGGLLTYGMLNTFDMSYGLRHRLVTRGIFYEFFKQLEGSSFDVPNAQIVLREMVDQESNITFWNKTKFLRVIQNNTKGIIGVEVIRNGMGKKIFARRVIDATQDAEVAVAAGVPYIDGGADRGYPGKYMASTLVFGLQGVNWEKIRTLLRHDGDPLTGADNYSAWGFLDEMKRYSSISHRIKMRGLNMGRQRDGTVLINALLIFDVNGANPQSQANALRTAKKELPYITHFLNKHVTGFEKATLKIVAPELYVRETRHIFGEYMLTINDVMENRDYWDRIAVGAYPVDIQAMDLHNQGVIIGKPVQYSIPFRCLVPKDVDNLLVVGRSASYSSVAMGTARVVPVGMCEGEAAGVAAAYSIWKDISFQQITKDHVAISDIQDILMQRGAYLQPFKIFNPNTAHWSYPAVRVLLPTSVVQGKYSNNLHFDDVVSEKKLFYSTGDIMKVLRGRNYVMAIDKKYRKKLLNDPITAKKTCYYLLIMNGYEKETTITKDYIKLAKLKGLLSPLLLSHGFGGNEVTTAQMYELLATTYKKQFKNRTNIYAPLPEIVK